MRRSVPALLTLVAALMATPGSADAQPRPTRPDVPDLFAIRGARIVTVSGPTLENGTVVVDDGVITAVGPNVTIPAGAWIVDGSGKTVYPGLIDAFTDIGHEYDPPGPGSGGGPQADESEHSWGPEDRPGTSSWLTAAEDIDGADARIESWRDAGFTTVLSTLVPGLVTGQAAVLDLGAFDRAREMVVETPAAMRLNLEDRSYSGYPANILGVFAYLKQLYMDAAHYGLVWDDYDASPRGKARPEWDGALEAIRQQLREGWPVLFPATDRVEIGRAIRTSRLMGVRPIVYGAQGAYEAADLLAAEGIPALVSLDWPEPPRDGDPEARPPLKQLRLWDRAATTPAELSSAGVRFAFYSGGMDDPAEMIAAARDAIAQGLSVAAAVRAFTLSAAEIFGVDDRLGSIEQGKIANLIVTSGGLFDEGSRVQTVFVDGDRFDVGSTTTEASTEDDAPQGRAREERADRSAPPVPMSDDRGPYRDDPVTFIHGATIMTASHGTIQNGDIIIRDGRIAEVGSGLRAPSGAHVVDATGKFVTPGIVDAHSHLAAAGINEGSVNVSAMVGIRDVINPEDIGIYYALAGGVTSINILHGSANPIGGQNAVVKLRWGADAEDLLIPDAPPGIKFALGENVTRDRNPDRYPATRMGQQDVIRQALLDAQAYQRLWDAYEAGGRQGIPPRRDLELEALAEVLRGERYVHSHCYRADEILQLLRVAEEFGFRIRTLQHVLEGYKVADEIAAHGAGASTFSDWWAYKVEAYDAIPYNAALLTERGVLVSINSDSDEEMRHLNQEAGKTMKWGDMTEEQALRMVTLNPAMQLGIDGHTGSIDVGKDADLVVFDGYPLGMFAKPLQTYVDGKLYFDIDLDRERQGAVQAEREALMQRHGIGASGERATADRVAGPQRLREEVGR